MKVLWNYKYIPVLEGPNVKTIQIFHFYRYPFLGFQGRQVSLRSFLHQPSSSSSSSIYNLSWSYKSEMVPWGVSFGGGNWRHCSSVPFGREILAFLCLFSDIIIIFYIITYMIHWIYFRISQMEIYIDHIHNIKYFHLDPHRYKENH